VCGSQFSIEKFVGPNGQHYKIIEKMLKANLNLRICTPGYEEVHFPALNSVVDVGEVSFRSLLPLRNIPLESVLVGARSLSR
jgi:hypothetical protein